MPNLRIIAVPAELYYRERVSKERAAPVAEKMFEEMYAALTEPLTEAEKQPKPKKIGAGTLKYKGDTMEAALDEFNSQFLENQWGDGLPLVAPTPERVKKMLSGTSRKPTEELGTMSPRNGSVTVEKIAINAVMAGAKPEYLPVIIAAVEGMVDPEFDELHFSTSTGSFSMVIAVSGPIAAELGMNSGLGMFSFGNQANSAIGRAVRLSLTNFGHTWPAQNDMALIGRPSAHAFLTFAENQDLSPWPSYHEALGYRAEDSTVSVSVTGGWGAAGLSSYGGGAVALVPPEQVLQSVLRDVGGAPAAGSGPGARGGQGAAAPGATGGTSQARDVAQAYTTGGAAAPAPTPPAQGAPGRSFGGRKVVVIFNPEIAQELASSLGYTRESLQEYLSQGGSQVEIYVAGGIPGYTLTMSYFKNGVYKPVTHMTKPVTGATLTQAGRTAEKK